MASLQESRSFALGTKVITPSAHEKLVPADVLAALFRHSACDWGNVCKEDAEENNLALTTGARLLSSYRDRKGTDFWIITEADRSVTTVLLPEDY